MDREHHCEQNTTAPAVLSALLKECSTITEYHTLQENLPRSLAKLLKCRCVLLYMRMGETLQFTSGFFSEAPGWSASLLTVAQINPISIESMLPEAQAWRSCQVVAYPEDAPTRLIAPLLYRQQRIGVLLVLRGEEEGDLENVAHWQEDDRALLDATACVVALLLENTRLLERERERIHELSLLNSISSQMNYSLYEMDKMRRIVLQRAQEIATADRCSLLEPGGEAPDWVSGQLRALLFQRFSEQHSLQPLVIERPGDGNQHTSDYIYQLPIAMRTFFAVPLLSGRIAGRDSRPFLPSNIRDIGGEAHPIPRVLGIIVGGYHRNRKLLREELILLQVLSSQAGVVLENIRLMTEVVEARNEARKLLHQVLDDQRFKEVILESIPSGLITTDQRGNITTINRAAEDILGYPPHEVFGQPLLHLFDIQSYPALKQHWESIVAQAGGDSARGMLRDRHAQEVCSAVVASVDREGREVALDVTLLPLYDGHAEPIGALVTFSDVTSMRRLEEEKRRLDRLASLGEMAANVAHEVRNPLASIKTSMQMLIDDLGGSTVPAWQGENISIVVAQESVSVVLKEVERLDVLVRELLLFARPRQLHRSMCAIDVLCDHVLRLLQHHCREAGVVVQRQYSPMPALYADVGQIEQVLFNLAMNSIQAMPDGGVLTLSCRLLTSEKALSDAEHALSRQVRQSAALLQRYQEGRKEVTTQWVEIAMSDTGVGIAWDQQEQIFQPFFTTKAHGIGLGLAITRRLIEDHGGYIQVEGKVGQGAIFAVRLPLLSPAQLQMQDDEADEQDQERDVK